MSDRLPGSESSGWGATGPRAADRDGLKGKRRSHAGQPKGWSQRAMPVRIEPAGLDQPDPFAVGVGIARGTGAMPGIDRGSSGPTTASTLSRGPESMRAIPWVQ